jgi:hypothetical protein
MPEAVRTAPPHPTPQALAAHLQSHYPGAAIWYGRSSGAWYLLHRGRLQVHPTPGALVAALEAEAGGGPAW